MPKKREKGKISDASLFLSLATFERLTHVVGSSRVGSKNYGYVFLDGERSCISRDEKERRDQILEQKRNERTGALSLPGFRLKENLPLPMIR